MSTDSTELTFVRCPSCRSLVPAVSTRCRMCGASLDASAAAQAEENENGEESSGRVRQRTMSKSKSALGSTASQVREEIAGAADELEKGGTQELSAYKGIVDPEVSEVASKKSAASSDDSLDEDEQPLDDPLGDYLDDMNGTAKQSGIAVAGAGSKAGSKAKEEKPAVRIETGGKRGGGLSFGKSEKGDGKKAKPKESKAKQQPSKSAKQDSSSQEKKRSGVAVAKQGDPKQPNKSEEPKEKVARAEGKAPEPDSVSPKSVAEADSAPKKKTGKQPAVGSTKGRLFGWLVSYENSDGEATELREGKFFITRSSLKEKDLVLDHETISTPHAIVTVNPQKDVEIQDLMSDQGVYVRRRGEDTYHREEEVVTVGHGDWLRLGEVEFLVTLIAHVGEG